MEILLKIALTLAVVAGTSATQYMCSSLGETHRDCTGRIRFYSIYHFQNCSGRGLSFPPPGLWSNVTYLNLSNNTITYLPANSLTGFPALQDLDLSDNSLTRLDFKELATNTNLRALNIQNNQIETLTQPPRGTTFQRLTYIDARNNGISDLDRDFFSFAPDLSSLDIRNNPLIVVPGHPVLNHPKVEKLHMSFGGTGLNVVHSTLLAGLPNLWNVGIFSSNISSVEGAFVSNKRLEFIHLRDNSITQIIPGTFPALGRLRKINLSGNPLSRLEPAAINNTMDSYGKINISDTPLACECWYEALSRLAESKNIVIKASCGATHSCSFT